MILIRQVSYEESLKVLQFFRTHPKRKECVVGLGDGTQSQWTRDDIPKLDAIIAARRFQPCSGQSGRGVLSKPRKNDWGVCRMEGSDASWRLRDRRGHQRLFPSREKAELAALECEKLPDDELPRG